MIAPGLAAPHHQHLFCARLDLDVDGADNTVYEVEAETVPAGPDNPWGNAFRPTVDPPRHASSAARRDVERGDEPRVAGRQPERRATGSVSRSATSSSRRCRRRRCSRDPSRASAGGPGSPATTSGSRRTRADERRAAGEYPNQHAGGDGLPRWTAADRSLVDTDVVLWYTFGVTHFVRPEDWPVMPVEYTGFLLVAGRLLRPQPRARRRRRPRSTEQLPRSEERLMTGHDRARRAARPS